MALLATLLLWTLITVHTIIFVFDVTQIVPQFDFVTREDGTASDKYNLLPLETIYAAITGLAFGTVAAALLAYVFGLGPVSYAAFISMFTHAVWMVHMAVKWQVWDDMMHEDGSMTPTFFFMTHLILFAMSLLLYIQPEPEPKQKSKAS